MQDYPLPAFHFQVSFLGLSGSSVDTQFQSVSGLEASFQTETYHEGGDNRGTYILPVRTENPPLVLKRGLFTNSDLVKWCQAAFNDMILLPLDLTVNLLDENHEPVMSWMVASALPQRWSISDLDAERSALAIETLELRYRYFRIL